MKTKNVTILHLGRDAARIVVNATTGWKQASAPNGKGFLWARTTPTLKLWAYGRLVDGSSHYCTKMVLHIKGKDAKLFIQSLNFLDHFKNHVLEIEDIDGERDFVEITDEEYDRQMAATNSLWRAPGSGNRAWYDDEKSAEAQATRQRYENLFVNAWSDPEAKQTNSDRLALISAMKHFESVAYVLSGEESLDSAAL